MISLKKSKNLIHAGIRQSADVMNMMTSAERVLEYCDLEPEKQPKNPLEVSQDWPTEGKVEFRNVFYRYFEDAEPVLRNLSFVVKPKEKIGTFVRQIERIFDFDLNQNII